MSDQKRCKICREHKPFAAFHRARNMKDGHASACIPCHNERYGVGSPAFNKHRRETRRRNWPAKMARRARERAAALNVPFDLLPLDIVVPERCPVLGIPINFEAATGFGPNSPNIDRIRPELGYIAGNIKVISGRANFLKADETDPEVFEKIAAYLRRERKV